MIIPSTPGPSEPSTASIAIPARDRRHAPGRPAAVIVIVVLFLASGLMAAGYPAATAP